METKTATEVPAIAPETVETPALTQEEDLEAKFKQLEEEKNNYRAAYLKEQDKNKAAKENLGGTLDEDRISEIVDKRLADSRIVEIAREQDSIIQKALKENKELKLAQLNKTTATPAAAVGAHSEARAVQDTSVTPEQMTAFKAKGWTDKDIERYKENLRKKL